MRRRMVYNIRPVSWKHAVHLTPIAHGTDQHHQIQIGIFPFELLLDVVCIILIDVKYNQLSRAVCRNLTAELASDTAASPGHQHHLVRYIAADLFRHDPDRLPAQQVFNLYIAQLGYAHLALHKLIYSGQDLKFTVRHVLADG